MSYTADSSFKNSFHAFLEKSWNKPFEITSLIITKQPVTITDTKRAYCIELIKADGGLAHCITDNSTS